MYEKRGGDRVGRGRGRKEAIAELLKKGVTRLQAHTHPKLLHVLQEVNVISLFKFILQIVDKSCLCRLKKMASV